ncbi:glycoside hydrolase family 9 protein [Paenibacillus daejeonensis]|uniref:glycoside hydrolase family 9 protein n=1 Tax=Paenibacillus daejeonensis TaxID=135193 RepID=UPI00036398EC|nr:glycoside hydrolase family 9 protein [Paenibacillus daejeonensis]
MLSCVSGWTSVRRMLCAGLSALLLLQVLAISPVPVAAAAPPLPGPGTPLIYDDFGGGGVFKQNWMNWFNQAGGTGAFSRTTADGRSVGVFSQTPATASSWAKFQPWNEQVDLSGYRYVNITLSNPDYPDARLRVAVQDGTRSVNLTDGWVAVDEDWTTLTLDLDTLSPALDKKKIRFEIWLRQTGGAYGEILVDELTATTAQSGSAPVLSDYGVTANTSGAYTQNTNFSFHATYTDADNEPPYAIQVVINDTPYPMREADPGDLDYTDGKAYTYTTQLPPGGHAYYFRTTDTTSDGDQTTIQPGLTVIHAEQTIDVVVSQAGYNAGDLKTAQVIASQPLTDESYEVRSGGTAVHTGTLNYQGIVWDKHVYTADFSALSSASGSFTVVSNGISSYAFPIQSNVWDNYRDEMTAFYRLLRSGVATEDAYPAGYSTAAPSAKLYHPAGHLDDAASTDGSQHYDLTGSWYDAGDYGKYGGNQWVGAQIALAYIRHAGDAAVSYDLDGNGIPDLIDEAVFGSEYLIKFADQLDGAMFNLRNNASFVHPHKATDNIPGTADDRRLTDPGVGGSAKSSGTLAATARAIRIAIVNGDIPASLATEMEAFAQASEEAALVFYDYVLANPTAPIGSYSTQGGIANSRLLAEVQLYLLTGDTDYRDAASTQINSLTLADLASTNYWDMRPMSMAELYPQADSTTQAHIQDLLRQQVDYFLSLADDTPYGVLNRFGNFGVNEPHVSYLGDLMRYYELFGDETVLEAIHRGLYWIFGQNPWNISWVSGIGTDYTRFLHTRYDEEANTAGGQGIVLPGAMVSGPNMKDPANRQSVSPWYEDRSMYADSINQWRYNEFSISIQAGLLYTIMALSAADTSTSTPGTPPTALPILTPGFGDYVRGQVTVQVPVVAGLSDYAFFTPGAAYTPMTLEGDVYTAVVDESATAAYTNKRVEVRARDSAGRYTYSSVQYTVAPPLPGPSSPLVYDDMGGGGWWGTVGGNNQWVNWYTQNGGSATFAKETVDGRTVGRFTQTPGSATSNAKFQPWHDTADFSGYRYIRLTAKNPGYSDLRMRVELSDGTRTHNLTGGWVPVPDTWTDLQFDLNALAHPVNKKTSKLSVWLNQSTGTYGELLIDDIRAVNAASGSAPVLSDGTVTPATGDAETDYTFAVTYTDADNEAPYAVELNVGGVLHRMSAADPGDTNYADGKSYALTTKLPQGMHTYTFQTTDTTSDAVATLPASLTVSADGDGEPEPEPGTVVLFADDFSAGDGAWTTTSGTWSIQDGAYAGQAGSGISLALAGDGTWSDYTYEARVSITNNAGGNKDAGLVFRHTDADNGYILYLKNNDRSGRKLELVRNVGGVRTTLAYANPSIAGDTFYAYKIVVEGDSIEVYQDDVLQVSATDSTHATGSIGLRVYANTKAFFDDIVVTELNS